MCLFQFRFPHCVCPAMELLVHMAGTPFQHSCLENPMDGGAWWATVHGVAKSRQDSATSLSLFTFMHWRRKWQPTLVFLPGESQGWGASWAAVYGVTQSQTRLKRLSSSSSSMAVLFPVFQGIFTLFSIVDVSVYIPTSSVRRLSFLHTLSSIYCLYKFWW